MDASGNLHGTTLGGGANMNDEGGGTVFRLSNAGSLKVLHSFCAKIDCDDGADPVGGVIMDANGNLFGATQISGPLPS